MSIYLCNFAFKVLLYKLTTPRWQPKKKRLRESITKPLKRIRKKNKKSQMQDLRGEDAMDQSFEPDQKCLSPIDT